MTAYKHEERNTWYCTFYYTDWTGQRRRKKKEGFETKRAALEWERQFLDKAAGSCDMLFSSLVELYLADCKTRLKPSTVSNKLCICNTTILPAFKDKPINTITPADVRSWQNHLLTECQYTDTTLRMTHGQLSAIFNYAVKFYKLPNNPAALCGSIGKAKADRLNFWTLAQFRLFISAVKKPAHYAAFNILFWTGCRIGELLALTPADFDLSSNTLHISKTYYKPIGAPAIMQTPKTPKSIRTITLPPFLSDIVHEYIAKLIEIQPHERLFECVSRTGIQYTFKSTLTAVGLPEIRIHDLRHSHASMLIEQGFSPLLIRDRLGHENIQTTLQTYSHLYPNKQNEVAEKLQTLYNAD